MTKLKLVSKWLKLPRRVVRWYRRQSLDAKTPRCNASAEHLKKALLTRTFLFAGPPFSEYGSLSPVLCKMSMPARADAVLLTRLLKSLTCSNVPDSSFCQGGRGSSVPSLHTSNDFACDTASDYGSPIDPGNAVDWRTIGEAFASYVVPVQDELAKAEARPDIRGRINVKGKILPPCSPPPLHTAAAPSKPHKFPSGGSSINDGSTLCFPCADPEFNAMILPSDVSSSVLYDFFKVQSR